MKKKMHACFATVVALSIVAVGTQGSMQHVFASGTTLTKTNIYAGSKAKMTVVSASNDDYYEDDSMEASIDIVVGEASGSTKNVSKADLSGEVAGIPYDKLVMANVDQAVNVRETASEDATILGKLYKNCAGEILEKGSEWTKIKTGKLTGWVSNDYLLFEGDAKKLADSVVEKVATSTTSCLRVRKEANADATVLDLLAEGDEIEVVKELDEWVEVEFSDGTEGYVSKEYVTISDEIAKGETIESIKAKEEALKSVKAQKDTQKSSKGSSDASSSTSAANVSAAGYDDVTLLAALIQSEAGNECYEGQVSVGAVVMNRLRTGRYGSSVYSVIYAKGQFSPAGSGRVAQICACGPKSSCVQAAQAAIGGASFVGGATAFRPVNSGKQGIVVGNHVFW